MPRRLEARDPRRQGLGRYTLSAPERPVRGFELQPASAQYPGAKARIMTLSIFAHELAAVSLARLSLPAFKHDRPPNL
jgi:hypothetical protein